MKKVILVTVVFVFGFIGFAQETAITSQQLKGSSTAFNHVLDSKMFDDMTSDDLTSEFVNNFFKIELSDVQINNQEDISNQKSEFSKVNLTNTKDMMNEFIISDIAVRTTTEMRPSLQSVREIIA